MIIDRIENAPLYFGLGERFERGLKEMMKCASEPLEKKSVELEGRDLRYGISNVKCDRAPDDNDYEAHVKFADIQCVLDGTEYMGWANLHDLRLRKAYDADGDIAWYTGKGTMLCVQKGYFAIFFPEDAHMPCRNNGVEPCESVKMVMKVRVVD